ncbi:uncharacterized protein BO96DRAFT_430696 [Aspergillus niger CBS 101883]|uniref:uncharacterized protein n=1 Tax=Aspergillus lacticoffeatus (strain CBS 101883) TaxID=1450533 RepID=UPI000D7FFA4B|nr:uncharacterized protein BO96DRAFT_430696 [Aspergillus niger CBS 101883]PYH60785.1 hypothetical protein BO96DRAFT_430696 [Aspergillus niger CBS 101883]
MWSWDKLRLIDGVTGDVSMHSRGLSDKFQPCGVSRVMDTVDDDQPLTASAAIEKDTAQSGLSKTEVERRWIDVCPASRSWSPGLLDLGLGPELSLSHATAQRPGNLQEAIISESVLSIVPGNGLCPWSTSGAGMSRARDAEDCHTFSPVNTIINLEMIDSFLDKHFNLGAKVPYRRKFVSLSTAREETRRIDHHFCQTMLIDRKAASGAAHSALVTLTRRHRTDSSTQSHVHWLISTPTLWIDRSGVCVKISYQPKGVGDHELVVDMEYLSPKFDDMETRQLVAFWSDSERLDKVLYALLQSDGVLRPGTSIQSPQTDCVQVDTKNESIVCKYFWQVGTPWPWSATGVLTILSPRTLDGSNGLWTGTTIVAFRGNLSEYSESSGTMNQTKDFRLVYNSTGQLSRECW